LRLACLLALAEVDEAPPQASLQLRRRLLREGDREDAVDSHVVVHHGLHEPLDQHTRLAAARPGVQEERPVAALDRLALLRSEPELHQRSSRQIEGYEQPPFQAQVSGHGRTSPDRIRPAISRTRSRARSSSSRTPSASRTSLPTNPSPSSHATSSSSSPRGLPLRSASGT